MTSATSGVFEIPPQQLLESPTYLVILDIPKGLLTKPGWVKIAATVEGLTADGLVQLKYRDLLLCADQACQQIRKP